MAVLIPFRALCSCCFLVWATADWVVELSSTGEEAVGGVAVDSAANPIVAVSSNTAVVSGLTLIGQEDIFVLKYNDAGTLQSQWSFRTTAKDVASCMTVDSSDNIFVAGSTEGEWPGQSQTNPSGFENIVLFKLNSAGSQQWAVQLDEVGVVNSVAVDSAQNVILGGDVFGDLAGFTNAGSSDLAVFKFDSTGTQLWAFQIGTSLSETAGGLAVDSSDNIIMCGTGEVYSGDTAVAFDGNTVYGGSDIFVFKLTSTGSKAWSDQIGGSGDDEASAVAVDSSDNVYVTGKVTGQLSGATSQGGTDACVIKYDTNGVQQWVKQIGTASDDQGDQIVVDSDTLYVSGTTYGDFYGTNAGGRDYFVVIMDTAGNEMRGALYGTDKDEYQKYELGGYTPRTTLSHDASGNIYAMGTAWDVSAVEYDAFLWKIAPPTTTTTATTATSTATSRTTTDTTATSTATTWTTTTTTTATTATSTATSRTTTATTATSTATTWTTTTATSATSTATSTTTTSTTATTATTATSTATSRTTTATTVTSTATTSTTTTTTTSIPANTATSTATSRTTTSTTATATSTNVTLDSTTTSSASNTSSEAEEQVLLSAEEVEALEAQRKEQAAAAVAAVDAAVDAAVQEALSDLFGGNADTSNPGVLGEVLVQSPVGPVKLAAFSEASLAAAGGFATVSGGDGNESAALEVNSAVLGEVGGDVLLSVASITAADVIASLETDHALAEKKARRLASQLRSELISVDFRNYDGQTFDVNGLTAPLKMKIPTDDPNTTCAFWDEETSTWSSEGVVTLFEEATEGFISCASTHLSIFGAVVDVFLKNIIAALACSTLGSLMTEEAFNTMVTQGKYLGQSPALASFSFLLAMIIALCVSCPADRRSFVQIPWHEREIVLMRPKKTLEEMEEEEKENAEKEEEKGSKVFSMVSYVLQKLRGGAETMLDLLEKATGESYLEQIKEAVANADTATINGSIEMLQSHRSGADQATIEALNNGGTKAVTKLQGLKVMRSKSNLSDIEETRPNATISQVQKWSSRAADHGQGSAERFLGGNFFWRFILLFPASHNWLQIYQLSILIPYSVRVVLIGMKVIGNGALNALFFASDAPLPDSDPECDPPVDLVGQWVQSLTVGLVSAFLTDVCIYMLYLVQRKMVIEGDWEDDMKIRQRRWWRCRTISFWILTFLYGSICQLYTILFIANVREVDSQQWLQATIIGLLQDVILKPFLLCLIQTTISSFMLCCRPTLKRRIQEEWTEDAETVRSYSKEFNNLEGITEEKVEEGNEEDQADQCGSEAESEESLAKVSCDSSIFTEFEEARL